MHYRLYRNNLYDNFISTNNMMKGEIIMKKTSKIIIALVTVFALGLLVAGCSCSNTDNKSNSTDGVVAPKSTNDNRGGDTKGNIVGKWKFDDPRVNISYVFLEDGNGSYDYSGQVLDFTYTTTNTELTITFKKDNNAPLKSPYTVTNDTLTIKDASGKDLVYKKVSESRDSANHPAPKFKEGDKVTVDDTPEFDEIIVKEVLWWTDDEGWFYEVKGHMIDIGWLDPMGGVSEIYMHPAQ